MDEPGRNYNEGHTMGRRERAGNQEMGFLKGRHWVKEQQEGQGGVMFKRSLREDGGKRWVRIVRLEKLRIEDSKTYGLCDNRTQELPF